MSPGQLQLFEDQSARNLIVSVPLKECRVEKTKINDGHKQKGIHTYSPFVRGETRNGHQNAKRNPNRNQETIVVGLFSLEI